MSLASEIKNIQYSSSRINQATKDKAIREIIDSYVKDYGKDVPLLEKVVKGETTFQDELKRLGPEKFMKDYKLVVCVLHGNFDVIPSLEIMDENIKRLYWKEKMKEDRLNDNKYELQRYLRNLGMDDVSTLDMDMLFRKSNEIMDNVRNAMDQYISYPEHHPLKKYYGRKVSNLERAFDNIFANRQEFLESLIYLYNAIKYE